MQRLVFNLNGVIKADMVAGNCDLSIGTEHASYDKGTEVVFAVDGSVLVERISGVGAWLKDRAVFAVTQ